MKKIFKVYAKSISRYSIEVEAEDAYEAYNIAKNTDGGNFVGEEICGINGTWDIEYDTIEKL